jgi:3-oxoacyl-[acyl-carrier-protein] synthase III
MPPNIIIESLGTYLPPRVVTTRAVLDGLRHPLELPLERITGIASRRVVGAGEYSLDLAKKAIENCLANSQYGPGDIDLLISCNISRCDGSHARFSIEPCTSIKLRAHFGFHAALTLDVTNACAGTFTAIYIAESLIRAGAARRAMVASGEYITCLSDTAQREITGLHDSRLACLTLGDSACAMILEATNQASLGFRALDLYTLGRYSTYCMAWATEEAPGGPIMHTDSIRLAALAIREGVAHGKRIIEEQGISPESIAHLIMHQTSSRSIKDAAQEANRAFGHPIWHDGNVVDDLAARGNTATNSHFIAIADHIAAGRLHSGDAVLFSIAASGVTIGTALYTFDDLPDRLRGRAAGSPRLASGPQAAVRLRRQTHSAPSLVPERIPAERIPIVGVGTTLPKPDCEPDAIELATEAGAQCLRQGGCRSSDVELFLYAGVYRNRFLFEPALGAIVAGRLQSGEPTMARQGFAFDVFNGALGFLTACYVATQVLQTRRLRYALILASEIEHNGGGPPELRRGVVEAGSAVLLEHADPGTGRLASRAGFGRFVFRAATEYLGDVEAYVHLEHGQARLRWSICPEVEDHYLTCVSAAVRDLLVLEHLRLPQVKLIVPPPLSPRFTARLARALGATDEQCVTLRDQTGDLFTSSLPFALQQLEERRMVAPDDITLLIGVGSGLQAGCATYYW